MKLTVLIFGPLDILIKYYGLTGLNLFHIVIIIQNPFIPIAYSYPNLVDERYSSDGYNVGINYGEAAGKTMMHLHIHLIPKYIGEIENIRVGVRGFS